MEALAWQKHDEKRFDEALGILETPDLGGYDPKNVRERVHHYLSRRAKDLSNHETLVRLADLDKEEGRVITTNFDTLFERAYRKLKRIERFDRGLTVRVAPALPPAKPETFNGLVYLHGRLGSSPEDRELVLTTGDFGMAYMLEGWALRFVVELARHFHVVFIGYSLEDPTMRYLVRALAVARDGNPQQFKEAFAFTAYDGGADSGAREKAETEWSISGITPLPFDKAGNYGELWTNLRAWADDHRQGISGRRQKVARLGQHPPVVGEGDSTARELAWALKDPKVATYFANLKGNRRPKSGWIPHLQKQGLFGLPTSRNDDGTEIGASLVAGVLNDSVGLHPATYQLGRWICSCLDSQDAIDWILGQGAVLHVALRNLVQHELRRKAGTDFPSSARKLWQVLADHGYAHMLSEKNVRDEYDYLARVRLASSVPFTTLAFLNRVRPIPVFKIALDYFRGEGSPNPERPRDWYDIKMELVGIEADHEIVSLRERAEDWPNALAMMAEDVTTRLNEAMEWFSEFGMASEDMDRTRLEYRSIGPHEESVLAPTWTQLIGLARDSHDALCARGEKAAAARLVGRWRSLKYPIFRRLALHAATEPSDADVEGGVEVLLDDAKPALWDLYAVRETSRFLNKRGVDIESGQLDRLIEAILGGPPRQMYRDDLSEEEWEKIRNRQILSRLHNLIESGVNLPSRAQVAHDRIHESEESVALGSLGRGAHRLGDEEPLEDFSGMGVGEFVNWSETQSIHDASPWDCGGGWGEFVEKDFVAAVRLLKGAGEQGVWPIPPWYMALSERNQKNKKKQTDEEKKEVANLVIGMPSQTLAVLADCSARWLQNNRLRLGKRLRQKLWRRIWNASLNGDAPEGELDLDMALNHSGGILGEVLYKEVAERIPTVSPGQNAGFPRLLRLDFERLVESEDPSAKLARVSMAPMLFALFRMDPDWTRRTFFVRMNPADRERFEPHLWEAYFFRVRWTADLLAEFKTSFLGVLGERSLISDRVHDNAISLFVHMAIPIGRRIDAEEARDVLWQLGPKGLTHAAMALRDILQGAGQKSSVLWKETVGPWLRDVWPKRASDRSRTLSGRLAWMATEAGDAFPEAVETIKDMLTQEKHSSVLYELTVKEKECKLVSRYPNASLVLMDTVAHDNSSRDLLGRVLEIIAEAEPELTENDLFKNLSEGLE